MARFILFDVDMTLISTLRAGRTALAGAFEDLFGLEDPIGDTRIDGRTDHAIFREIIARHSLADGDIDAVYRRVCDAYLERLPRALAEREGFVLPGVPALLDALAASHRAVGLATGNMRRGAAIKLGAFGLWERFPTGGFGDDTPVRAELVAEAIHSLAEHLGLPAHPHDAIVIGDTPLDVEAAHHAGARALGVATGRYTVDELLASGAEHALPDLGDTPAVLRILTS
ncbi:MAG: haloacid dehalogenase-like hydrolase [Dehalococcoidia bacterium]|nr:haloacid dehalogenase-like hydrolase [Dehalococcoidia bacterium]